MDILQDIVGEVKSLLPQFNKTLIRQTRQNMIKNIDERVSRLMEYLVTDQIPGLTYHGYKAADPKQLAQHILDGDFYYPDINDSNLKLVIYDFSFQTEFGIEKCPFYCYMPYLWEERFELNGTKYYPVFTIMDIFISRLKSKNKDNVGKYEGLSFPFLIHNTIFRFRSRDKIKYVSTKGIPISGTILKLNAHKNFKPDSVVIPPALLYPLARFGLLETLISYGIEPEQLSFVESETPEDLYDFFKINDLLFMKVHKDLMRNVKNRRFIVTLLNIILSSSVPTIDFIYDREATYFKFILGRWIQGPEAPPLQQKNQAIEHLKTTDRLLDPMAKTALTEEGILVDSFYEVIHHVFYHIDSLMFNYEQNDLFEKKIAILPQLMFLFIYTMNNAIFNLRRIIASDRKLQIKDIRSVFKQCERLLVKRIEQLSSIFMSPGDLSNDNWLLSIGARKHRLRRLRNPKNKGSAGEGSIRTDETILAHPSQAYIESVLNLPASNPCIGGTINVFFKFVGEDGLFHRPPDYDKMKNIFSNNH